MIAAAESHLPRSFKDAVLARSYNILTGASLSHFDLERLNVFERDEVIALVNNADLIGD
jgi:hypothetical protein